MAPARCTPPMVDRLKDVLATHPGTTEVHLRLVNGEREHLLRLGEGFRVTPSAALMGDLKALLGPARDLGVAGGPLGRLGGDGFLASRTPPRVPTTSVAATTGPTSARFERLRRGVHR